METPPNNDEPLFTPRQIATMAAEPVEPFLQLVTSYVLTTWSLLTNPRAVIVSIFNTPLQESKLEPHRLSNRLKFWLLAPWKEKKQMWKGWFRANPKRPYPNSWSYLRSTVALFFFVSLVIGGVGYLYPSSFKKPDIIANYKAYMANFKRVSEQALGRPFNEEEQKVYDESVADEVKILTAQIPLTENDTVKQPAMLVIAFLLCYSLARLMRWRHKLPMRELLAVGRYGTALGLLAYLVGQLLTDVPAGYFTGLGDVLFGLCLVIAPAYYVARYIKKQRPAIRLWLNAGILMVCQGVLFFGAWKTYLYFGVKALAFLQHFHDTH